MKFFDMCEKDAMFHAPDKDLFAGPDGWHLAPEGAAVHLSERTAVIADVHLGYEWARGSGGDCLPAHSLAETLAKMTHLLARATVERLIVAGDLVESPRPCRRTAEDVRRLSRWLADRGVDLVALAGNHDPRRGTSTPETLKVAGWTIGHGHRAIPGDRTISGHLHPALCAGGVTAPCFLVGPSTIVLPAFSPNGAGWNVLSTPIPLPWCDDSLRCVAGLGEELLDFGPLPRLGRQFRPSAT